MLKITLRGATQNATQQFIAGERGKAFFATSFVRRGLRVIARAT
jgi:hypothetical protein